MAATAPSAPARLLALLREAVGRGTLVKLTLGGYQGPEASLRNVYVRPVVLRAGSRLSFVYRHETRDVTKNLSFEDAIACVEELLRSGFSTANLFTTEQAVELTTPKGKPPRLVMREPAHSEVGAPSHDRRKVRFIDASAARWLQALGVTNAQGVVREGMSAKFKQLNKFVEILHHALAEWPAASPSARGAIRLVDMGCGKGYLTFAAFDCLRAWGWGPVTVLGIEARPELVAAANRTAAEHGFAGLSFAAGTIESVALERTDVLVALHACDTATDDAIARGIRAGASLIFVAPCCHKELRPLLRPPPQLAGALRHGILRERQAEFVTDALRAALLEHAGYSTRVFEFVSTEHTAKNLMIAAIKRPAPFDPGAAADQVRELASFYGIRSQHLARQLGFALSEEAPDSP